MRAESMTAGDVLPEVDRCDVVVVGLGPVGAVLAGLLGQYGLSVIVVERAQEIYPLPRAAHFDHEIMRVFQRLGVADAVLPHTRVAGAYEFRAADRRLLMSARRGSEQGISGWAYAYMFNQPGVERALRDGLETLETVEIRLGSTFAGLEEASEAVTVTVVGDDGTERRIRASYLVGCDGAWSPVREAIGSPLEDFQFDEPWLVVDTIPRDQATMPEVNLQICDPARPTTCVLMGPGRHRWEFMLLPGETADDVLAPGFVESLLADWDVDVEIERKAVYRFHGLVAERWRCGRVFIAGDAAHQMPPFAGQGMCSGIRDAANLAWKLAAVISGTATSDLLDTYQAERDPNVRDYIRLAIGMGRVVCTLDPAIAAERDARMIAHLKAGDDPMPEVVKVGVDGAAVMPGDPAAGEIFPQFVAGEGSAALRLDDVLGRDAWLLSRGDEPDPAVPGLQRFAIDDRALAPFRDAVTRWLDDRGIEGVLVRPDRYIFGAGRSGDLVHGWRTALHATGFSQELVE